jgi:starch synthase
MVFFCKGVMETMKKFGWPPDIIHCHGWMTSLVPWYAKTAYKKEPVFANSKVIYSANENSLDGNLSADFEKKALIHKDLKTADFKLFKEGDNNALNLGAIQSADGLVIGDGNVNPAIVEAIKASGKNYLENVSPDVMESTFFDYYATFFKTK